MQQRINDATEWQRSVEVRKGLPAGCQGREIKRRRQEPCKPTAMNMGMTAGMIRMLVRVTHRALAGVSRMTGYLSCRGVVRMAGCVEVSVRFDR